MGLKASEISALIKKQIENYSAEIKADDVGTIVKIGDGIAIIQGLENAMSSELLEFPGGVYGMVLILRKIVLVRFYLAMILISKKMMK